MRSKDEREEGPGLWAAQNTERETDAKSVLGKANEAKENPQDSDEYEE